MILQNVINLLINTPEFQNDIKKFLKTGVLKYSGFSLGAKAYFISCVFHKLKQPFLLITSSLEEGKKYANYFEIFGIKNINFFPIPEISPYEFIFYDKQAIHQRHLVKNHLLEGKCDCIITTPKSLSFPMMNKNDWIKYNIKILKDNELSPEVLIQHLVQLGYKSVSLVSEIGEFSRKGGIIDIFPVGSPNPYRIEWFGDYVESIRLIDPELCRSIKNIDYITINPAYEVVVPIKEWESISNKIRENVQKQIQRLSEYQKQLLINKIEQHIEKFNLFEYFNECNYYLTYLHQNIVNILDYLPKNTSIIWTEYNVQYEKLLDWIKQIDKNYEDKLKEAEIIVLPKKLHFSINQIHKQIEKFSSIEFTSIPTGKKDEKQVYGTTLPIIDRHFDQMSHTLKEWIKENKKIFIVTNQPQRIMTILKERNCEVSFGDYHVRSLNKGIHIIKNNLFEGFCYSSINLFVLTDTELFGWKNRPVRIVRGEYKTGLPILHLYDLKVDSYVVHQIHGIGRYKGLKILDITGKKREYITIEYADNAKLYVPVEQMHTILLYRGGGEREPKLNKMGGKEWNKVKEKVKKSVRDIARELIELYAKRKQLSGYRFPPDSEWQREMESAFPYDETPDQMQAIIDTKKDMESDIPMDRLICGDVGFGKTEVALRAAFKAITSGKQVVLLCPTTILSQQHYDVFQQRFSPYPIRLSLLNRFKTKKETLQILNDLAMGTIDMVIATHRLLVNNPVFKDIGLLIIDEEHKFGVSHKEKIKKLKANIDVITMSATPIPRTLNMALEGLRDLSLIETPPENRLPIKTILAPYSSQIVKMAILNEMERNGQIYYVHNKVHTIGKILYQVQELVPQARICIAHGQLPKRELENIMLEFNNYEYDVLICTTIIESGLDIPNVNTIIVDQVDHLGLAQLYQLRGRVGRSEIQAYAYFLYDSDKNLTPQARERLQVIQEMTALGSGYQVALKDMEIRGIGEILGVHQHGQMLSVGFDTYCQLLEEAVVEIKGESIKKVKQPVTLIDLNIPAYIPDDWIGDYVLKMHIYRVLAQITNLNELEKIYLEYKDRYKKFPITVENLFEIVKLRIISSNIGIESIKEDIRYLKVKVQVSEQIWNKCLQKDPDLIRWKWNKHELYTYRALIGTEENLYLIKKLVNCLYLFLERR